MKMVVGPVAFGIVLAVSAACGPGSNAGAGGSGGGGATGGGGSGGSGGVDCSTLPRVELSVISSPLPTELDSGCALGNVNELDALLTLSKNAPCADTFNCPLTANGSGASGSCPNIPSNENYTVDLTYRALHSTGGQRPVALQSKYVQLPTGSPSVVNLSFAGEALEPFFQQNLTDWCSGNF